MANLHDITLDAVMRDFLRAGSDPQQSLLCRFLEAEHASSLRVSLKRLWNRGDARTLLMLMTERLLREGTLQKLLACEAIAPICAVGKKLLTGEAEQHEGAVSTRSEHSEPAARRRLGRAVRAQLEAILAQAATLGDDALPSLETLRPAADVLINATSRTGAYASLLEYRLDAHEHSGGLGSAEDRAKTLAAAQRATGQHEPCADTASFDKALTRTLVREARQWLANAGCSLREESLAGIVRAKDIPTGLVEAAIAEGLVRPYAAGEGAHDGTAALPIAARRPASDAFALYQALQRERRSWAVVPLEIDPLTGAACYVLGTSYFDDDARAWLFPPFKARRQLTLRGERGTRDHEQHRMNENRRARIDEARRMALRRNACVVVFVRHAQCADRLRGAVRVSGSLFDEHPDRMKEKRLVQGLFQDELEVWPLPIGTADAMERALAWFRHAFGGSSTNETVAAYRFANEEAPAHCPEPFLRYFDQGF